MNLTSNTTAREIGRTKHQAFIKAFHAIFSRLRQVGSEERRRMSGSPYDTLSPADRRHLGMLLARSAASVSHNRLSLVHHTQRSIKPNRKAN